MHSDASIDPTRDWLLILTFAIVVLAGVVVWNIWAFDTVASGGNIGSSAPEASPILNSGLLNTVRTTFETRAEEEAKYVTGVYRYSDPSH